MTRAGAAADAAAAVVDRSRLVFMAAAAVVALAALAVLVGQVAGVRAAADERAQRNAVRAAAPSIIAGVFDHTPTTVAADSRRARTLVSDEFAAANAAALSGDRIGAARWRTRSVGVGESGRDWVEAVAVVTVTDPRNPAVTDDRIVAVRFVSRDGRWLLDSVERIR